MGLTSILPRLFASTACLLATLGAAAARAEINVVRDLGCKVDRWDFDNGPILNAAFANVGRTLNQKLNEEFYLPGGALVFKTPLVIPPKTGIAIRGNGITLALNEAAFDKATGGPASRLVYIGPANQPAITYGGMGMKLDGVTIQRGQYPHPPAPPARDGSIALRITGYNSLPTGKLFAPQLAIIGFDTAIHISNEPNENHADQNQFVNLRIQDCWTAVRSENLQSVGNQFVFMAVNGWCDTVFDIRRGGDLVVDTLILNNGALILKLGDLEPNTDNYEIRTLKVDNNSAGWRLVEMTKPGPLRLRVGGHVGSQATPGEDAIKLLGDPGNRDVQVDLFWNGKRWPPPASK